MQGSGAGRRFIPVDKAFAQWDKESEFRGAYDALEEEFALAGALIEARLDDERTRGEVARDENDPVRDRPIGEGPELDKDQDARPLCPGR